MSRQDDLLRKACELLAQEECDAMESKLTPDEIAHAESLYRMHRRSIFSLIAAETEKKNHRRHPWLKAAACLILALGLGYASLHRKPEVKPLTPLATVSISPYFSPVPSETYFPTDSPIQSNTQSPVPTVIPQHTDFHASETSPIPTFSPSNAPTASPAPTATPTPVPTATPSPSVLPTQTPALFSRPDGWSGSYFPSTLPAGYELAEAEEGVGSHSALLILGTQSILFTEYDDQEMLSLPANTSASYVQLSDQIALLIIRDTQQQLIWQMDGRTFSLTCSQDDPIPLALSVKKVTGQ